MQDVDVNTPTCDGGLPVRVVMFDMAGVLVNDIVGPLRELAITKCSIQNERADELRRFWRKTWNEFKVLDLHLSLSLSLFFFFSLNQIL
jgi:hypothetical protein